MDEIVIELIEDICDELEIEVPNISDDVSMFPTDTTMAMADGMTYTIHIKEQNISPDYIFSIIHELRHLWQWKTDKRTYFDNYKNSDACSLEEYNLQLAELDANAYAAWIMIEEFGIKPLWEGQSEKVIDGIKKRMVEIAIEE